MGRLYYGNSTDAIAVDDRELAHLKVVATAKLRRSEGFAMTFASAKHGRSTVWIHCAIPLRFDFDSAEPIRLDPAHVNDLAQAAASSAGIVIDLDALARAERPELAVVA
ncbi:RNA polymerase subunit sigma [Microbacterium flavum]|uniref:RNA polymerase subunit sigma n=1 Tax=Microbacterium flavum TaxID=415216 RepID=A0ABS5XQD1_9MICO|nr:RNA polymerase subunit sigma [Microbacterium flavum]MBT8796735.1 RNA polymerase subunit sigma [Microbacterium flavum]